MYDYLSIVVSARWLMRKLNKQKLQAFAVITHDWQIAKTADRSIYSKDGLIEAFKEAPREE